VTNLPPFGPLPCSADLTRHERDILWHTEHRAAGGLYCGEIPESLITDGLMEYAGRKSFVPDPYYRITSKGRKALRSAKFKTYEKR